MLSILLFLPLRLLLRCGIVLLLLLLRLSLLTSSVVPSILLLSILLLLLLLLPCIGREWIEIRYELRMQSPRMGLRGRIVEGRSAWLEVLHSASRMTRGTKVQGCTALRCKVLSEPRLRLETCRLRLLVSRLLRIHLRLLLRLLRILLLLILRLLLLLPLLVHLLLLQLLRRCI